MPRRSYSVYRQAQPGADVTFAVLPSQRWRVMLAEVATSTDALETQARARSSEGTARNAFTVAGPSLWNPWEWTEQAPVADCPSELLIWADIWQAATTNLARLGADPVPKIDDPDALELWGELIRRNIGLLGPSSNLQPAFFRAGAPLDVPGYRTIPGGSHGPSRQSARGDLALATDAEMNGGGIPGARATSEIRPLIMGEAPKTGSGGFLECLGEAPLAPHWLRGVVFNRRTLEGWIADFGGTGPSIIDAIILPKGLIPAPRESFYVMGPNGDWLGKSDPTQGWALLVTAWARSGQPQVTVRPEGGAHDEVTADLTALFEGRRAYAAWISRLNLLEVLLRTTGFYASSYATFAAAVGFPEATGFADEAGELWRHLRENATHAAATPFSTTEGQIAMSVVGGVTAIVAAIFPPAGAIIAIAIAVVEGLTALLVEIGGAAVGHGVYTAQPLFVRQFSGECSANTLVTATERAANVYVTLEIEASRAAMAESVVERQESSRGVPWFQIAAGATVATVLGLGAVALFGGKKS